MERIELLRRVASAQDGMVTTEQALRVGFTRDDIRHHCRAGRWVRLARGCFRPWPSEERAADLRRARIRAAVTSLGADAFAVLGTAAELYGLAGLAPTSEIHISVPVAAPRAQRSTDPHLVVHQLTVPVGDTCRVAGIAATTPLRTLADLMLRAHRYPAVSLLDSALNRELITVTELAAIPALIRGRRGAVAARGYLAEADGRAQSPLETRTRLRCVDGRVPPDVLQLEVRDDDGYLLGIGDLGWRAPSVIAEADGRGPHGTPEAAYADRRRQNRLVNAGWTVLRFTWQDTLDPHYIPWTVRQALNRPRHLR